MLILFFDDVRYSRKETIQINYDNSNKAVYFHANSIISMLSAYTFCTKIYFSGAISVFIACWTMTMRWSPAFGYKLSTALRILLLILNFKSAITGERLILTLTQRFLKN